MSGAEASCREFGCRSKLGYACHESGAEIELLPPRFAVNLPTVRLFGTDQALSFKHLVEHAVTDISSGQFIELISNTWMPGVRAVVKTESSKRKNEGALEWIIESDHLYAAFHSRRVIAITKPCPDDTAASAAAKWCCRGCQQDASCRPDGVTVRSVHQWGPGSVNSEILYVDPASHASAWQYLTLEIGTRHTILSAPQIEQHFEHSRGRPVPTSLFYVPITIHGDEITVTVKADHWQKRELLATPDQFAATHDVLFVGRNGKTGKLMARFLERE